MPVEEETGTLHKGTKAAVQSNIINRTVIPAQPIQSSEIQKNRHYSEKSKFILSTLCSCAGNPSLERDRRHN